MASFMQNAANIAFLAGLVFTSVSWVCSLMILRKMRFEGFGTSDLWNPTGRMYRRYFQEAKRRNWSLLPVYIPFLLGALFLGYFLVVVVVILRNVH